MFKAELANATIKLIQLKTKESEDDDREESNKHLNIIHISCRNIPSKKMLMSKIISNIASGLKHLCFQPVTKRRIILNRIQVKDWFLAFQQSIKQDFLHICKHYRGENSHNSLLKYKVVNNKTGISASLTFDPVQVMTVDCFQDFQGHPCTNKQNSNPNRRREAFNHPFHVHRGVIEELIEIATEDDFPLYQILYFWQPRQNLKGKTESSGLMQLKMVRPQK